MRPASIEAYSLMHEGALALSRVEANGVRIDIEYLNRTIKEAGEKIRSLEETLKQDDVWRRWKRRFGEKANLTSSDQLGEILYGEMEYECSEYTPGSYYPDGSMKPVGYRKPKTTEASLTRVAEEGLEFVTQYLQLKKWDKVKGTYLEGIRREVESDGLLHCFYNLHTVRTYRGSSDRINFQNLPIRKEEFAALIRECFIPYDDDYVFGEVDFSGAEVRIAACYNHDPVLINYVCDPKSDMHRDQAVLCYMLDKKAVLANEKDYKQSRYAAKNMFVFPEFYGSFYVDCARHLYEAIDRLKLKTHDGISLKEHLAKQGITGLGKCDPSQKPRAGTFEHHIKEVEEEFWKRFTVYAQWKKRWLEEYFRNGGYRLLTGFVIEGIYKRNEIINGAIQGTAFHCLLWTLIQFQRWLDKYKMRTKICGQIHDSMPINFHRKEVEDCLHVLHNIISVQLPKAWPWICVPMEAEAEIAPPGCSWFHKKKVSMTESVEKLLVWQREANEGKGLWAWR